MVVLTVKLVALTLSVTWGLTKRILFGLGLPVVLYYLDGLTVAETAQALGVPVGTVKFRLHQARKKLRVELDAPEGEGANVQ